MIVLRELIKKEEKKNKKKEIMEGKIYSPVSNLAEWAILYTCNAELFFYAGTDSTNLIHSISDYINLV